MFAKGSRYEKVATDVYTGPDGRGIPYVLLRLIPDAPIQQRYIVAAGDRLDLVAYRVYDDPEQFWRICDANRALRPDDLMAEPERTILIPMALR